MIVYPVSFGSQVLHDQVNRFATKTVIPASSAPAQLVKLPNGELYDPFLGDDIAPVPGKFDTVIQMVFSSNALLSAEIDTVWALVGKRDFLTAKKPDGATVSCSARLETVTLRHPYEILTGGKTKIQLTFQPISVFK